jgi:predicted cupin superfamily sugar epimerase
MPTIAAVPISAADIIRLLDLKPHPEGGHFRETFRDTRTVDGGRAALASEASGQRGNSTVRAHSASKDARKRADDTRPQPGSSARAASTAICYLLARGERSHWHRIDAAEVWHFYAGSALRLEIAPNDKGPIERVTLGPDLAAGERPQAMVPPRAWQAAESLGDWTLAGCTVAPGFDFTHFELAPKGWAPSG